MALSATAAAFGKIVFIVYRLKNKTFSKNAQNCEAPNQCIDGVCTEPPKDSVKVCHNITYIDNYVSTQYMQLYKCPDGYTSFSECEPLMEVPGTCGQNGYEVLFHNGAIDGTRKTGSLSTVRNLYRSLGEDGEWFDFDIAVREKNISIKINGTDVVCYTEPAQPYRTEANKGKVLSHGGFALVGKKGDVKFRNLTVTMLKDGVLNPNDTLPPVDETTDEIIRLQQENFPVIDYHVHLKGGLTKEQAHAMEMNYGINYGVAPNVGEGGVGRMLANDQEAIEYYNEV